MRIYLDNNATTAIHPDVLATLDTMLRNVFGNASSIHKEGQTARQVIEDARESVARLIGATAREIVFTSGGTESNNAAIFGAVSTVGIHHIVTTAIEHPSVLEPVEELRRRGHEVDRRAAVTQRRRRCRSGDRRDARRHAARRDDAREQRDRRRAAGRGDRARLPRARRCTCTATRCRPRGRSTSMCKRSASTRSSLSAHKMHAPKGIGALYVRRGHEDESHLFGGAQERRRRAGTENVPLAAAFGVAATLAGEPAFERRSRARCAIDSNPRSPTSTSRSTARASRASRTLERHVPRCGRRGDRHRARSRRHRRLDRLGLLVRAASSRRTSCSRWDSRRRRRSRRCALSL